jgi:hypothetical protein
MKYHIMVGQFPYGRSLPAANPGVPESENKCFNFQARSAIAFGASWMTACTEERWPHTN